MIRCEGNVLASIKRRSSNLRTLPLFATIFCAKISILFSDSSMLPGTNVKIIPANMSLDGCTSGASMTMQSRFDDGEGDLDFLIWLES
jgi:hypothetical protein